LPQGYEGHERQSADPGQGAHADGKQEQQDFDDVGLELHKFRRQRNM
jgi:hypothetical protein